MAVHCCFALVKVKFVDWVAIVQEIHCVPL